MSRSPQKMPSPLASVSPCRMKWMRPHGRHRREAPAEGLAASRSLPAHQAGRGEQRLRRARRELARRPRGAAVTLGRLLALRRGAPSRARRRRRASPGRRMLRTKTSAALYELRTSGAARDVARSPSASPSRANASNVARARRSGRPPRASASGAGTGRGSPRRPRRRAGRAASRAPRRRSRRCRP